ncbi:UNVERIFIED_ORG: hypothetical protein BDK47_11824 [Anoxybacillus amylolyticus]
MVWDLRINQRVEIDFERNGEYEVVRGIVLEKQEDQILLISDKGKVECIEHGWVLSVRTIAFPRVVSDVLSRLKNYHVERMETEKKLQELYEQESFLIQQLRDAMFISNFSLQGAVHRLYMTIEEPLRMFQTRNLLFQISFATYGEVGVSVMIQVKTLFDHYQEDLSKLDVEQVLRIYHPRALDWVKRAFDGFSVTEEEAQVQHEEGETFCVKVKYHVVVPMDEQSFLEAREKIVAGLQRLKA